MSTAAVAKTGFEPFTEISTNSRAITELLGTGTLTEAVIHAEDVLGNFGKYSLPKNGFEFRWVPSECVQILDKLTCNPNASAARENFRNTFAPYVEVLAKNSWGYPDSIQAIPLDAVIRDTNPTKSGGFGAVGLVHIDFPENLGETVLNFEDTWGPRIAKKGFNAKESNFLGMVNVWMPLDDHVKADPLVVVDKKVPSSQSKKIYNAVRQDGSNFQAQ